MIFLNISAEWSVEKSDFQSDKITIFSKFMSTILFICNNVSNSIVHDSQVFKIH